MTTAIYARVSTDDQSIDRQQEECYNYCRNQLDDSSPEFYSDKGSGGDTDRTEFQKLLSSVNDGEIETVVVLELSRLSRSMRDLTATLETFEDYSTGLHVISRGLTLDPENKDPMTDAFFYLAGTFAELEREMIRERTKSGIKAAKEAGKHVGAPPKGFDTDDDGYLIPNENYDRCVTALEMLDDDESKRSVAKHTGISRRTLGRIQERSELYES
ncbi:recombinase family protein [Halorussus halophilus]|uniref:recombinase family protein n=1 Tax=Halorussus halophilus TaxID=2650975 RepID=UPI001300D6F4|nr:recombinase family protein [Halorussus halophilus]